MFALFAGYRYYPSGGWNDLVGVYDSLEEAEAAFGRGVEDFVYDWGHVVDLRTLDRVTLKGHSGTF